jgi:hypothetical protein
MLGRTQRQVNLAGIPRIVSGRWLDDMIQGVLVHMVVIGLPISFSVRRLAK